MSEVFFTNPQAVIFFPGIDRRNGFITVLYNPQTEKLIKVNRFGYEILKAIDENPGIISPQLLALISKKHKTPEWLNERRITDFINKMVKENIVFEK